MIVCLTAGLVFTITPATPVFAAGAITVDRTDDPAVTTAGSGAAACTGAANDCSLRGAVIFANANPGTTINVPAGTYQLTIDGNSEAGNCTDATIGDLDIAGNNTSIVGAGAASTIIQQTTSNDRVICVDQFLAGNFTFSISGVTITGGKETHGVGGGGMISGSVGDVTNITNVIFSNNSASGGGSPIGGGLGHSGGNLTLDTVTFSNNSSTGSGGGAYISANYTNCTAPCVGTFTVTNSTFTNNVSTGGDGGAIKFTSGNTYSISNSTFTGNQAQGATATGGAVVDESGSLSIDHSVFLNNAVTQSGARGGALGSVDGGGHNITVQFSRFVGNTAATTANGTALYTGYGNTTTATENWWGCNGGPNTSGCGTIANGPAHSPFAAGATNFTPWIVLTNTASPNPVQVNQTTTLTADFLHDSNGGALTTGQVSLLIGLPVTWSNAVKGALSNTQSTIQPNGTATATFTASAAGAGSADAKVDNGTATGNVTINKADTTTTITSETPDPTVTGQSYTVNFTLTSSTGSTPTAPSGNVTVSDGTNSCSGSIASGTCTITSTTTGSKTLTATYAGDSNFNGSTSNSVSHTVNKADTTTTITSDTPDPSVVGQPVAVQYSVSVNSPGGGTPTGNVTVSDGTLSCTGTVAAGQCSITFTSPGAKSLTATYAGDANYNASPTSASVSHQVNKADTTTTITSDNPDPSNAGQAVTVNFTVAPVAPGAGTPTGNVTVSDGVDSCTGTVASGTCNVTLTATGAQTLTATYASDSNFNGSTSAGEPHTVNKFATTTAITSDNPDPSVVGQSITVQYSVSAFSGTPTGNVTVSDGTVSCTGTVAAGQCALTFTSAGAKSLTATYAGDSTYDGSTSAAEPHQVNSADTTTTITSDNPDPSVVGQSVTVQFSVAATAPGAGTPTGNVTVSDGTVSCTASVATGQCSLNLTSAGAKSLTATYAGDSNFNGSTSVAEPHQVNKTDTTTAISSDNPDPSIVGQAVTVQYTVTPVLPGSGLPTGNVTVSDGTVSCTATVADGQCSLTFTSSGAKTLTATYAGDSNFNGSASASEPHTVNGIATTTTITSDSPDPSVVGQAVMVQYSVTSGSGTPTGNVTVSDGTVSCTGTVAAGQCSLTFTSTGAKSLTATYAGDSTFSGSTSAAAAHQVNKADTTTAITSDTPDPSIQGSAVTVQYSVAVNASGAGTPTGNVTVSDGVNSCTGTVAAGQCSITLNTIGNRTLTATYAGDSNFNGSTSVGEPHTVNPPNTPPTATVVNGACSPTNMASGTINLTLFDAESDPVTLVLASNTNTSLVPNANIVLGGTGYNRTITVTGAAKKKGTATLTFNLSDGKVTVPVVVTVKVGSNEDDKETINGTSGIDMIFGMNGINTINGNAGNDLLCGGNSTDTISGGDGNDIIDGENGNDILNGGNGNDILRGSLGNDKLTGGIGADFFSGGPGTDIATDFTPSQGDTTDGTIP